MRILLFTSLALALSAQDPIPLQAPIQRVRLHPTEAWITRSGKVQLPGPGTHRVVIKDLPPGLKVEDLQASARGFAGLKLGDLTASSEVRVVKETPEWKKLDAEREALMRRRDALEAKNESAKQVLGFLKALQAAQDKEISSRMTCSIPDTEALLNLTRGLEGRMDELLRGERERKHELEKLAEEEGRIAAELKKRAGDQQEGPGSVTLELSCSQAGPAEVDLSYRTKASRWRPVYEARLSEDRKHLSFALFAVVTQNTGEAWNRVRLEISTARPSSALQLASYATGQALDWGTILSQPAPVRTDPAGPRTMGNNIMYRIDGINVKDDAGGGSLYQPLQDSIEDISVSSNYATWTPSTPRPEAIVVTANTIEQAPGLVHTFLVEGLKDVQSDGEPHRFKVLVKEVDPSLVVFTAPRLDPSAALLARFEAPEGLPLFLGSPVVRFLGNQRMGEAPMAIPPSGQPFSLSFGPYKSLRVSFQRLGQKQETVGGFLRDRQWTLDERMELDNDGNETLDMEVQDRILKPGSHHVKTSLLPGFEPGSIETIPGVRCWKFRLDPKSHKTLKVPVSIRAPKEGYVVGLEGVTLGQP